MFNKPFKDIIFDDIKNLVFNRKERENNILDYKAEIDNSDHAKKEFLKDISAFANTDGGLLIIGVTEEDGIPKDIIGINKNLGNQKIDEWIDNVIFSNLQDKIRYELTIFPQENDNVVVLLHIPESPKKPHMVTYNKKNNYYLRHNTIVEPATQSEVKELFEISRKNINTLHNFLTNRKLINQNDSNFALTENAIKLYSDLKEHPFILYSLIPQYLDENRIQVASPEFLNWLDKAAKGYEPAPWTEIFNIFEKRINLYGVSFPKLLPPTQKEDEKYWNFSELLNNGYFEHGVSTEVFWSETIRNTPIKILSLTYSVGIALLLMNFAKQLYEKIRYYDEVLLQISIVNVKGFTLGGFDKAVWKEPTDFMFPEYSLRECAHDRFALREKLIISELSEKIIMQTAISVAQNISHAFGIQEVKCFDKNGIFNKEGMQYFRR